MSKYAKYLPLVLFSVYSAKLIAHGADLSDAAILFVLGLMTVAYEIRSRFEQVSQQTLESIKQFEAQLKNYNDNNELNKKVVEDLKTSVAGLKLSASARNLNGVR